MLHELAVGFAGDMSVASLMADDLDKRFLRGMELGYVWWQGVFGPWDGMAWHGWSGR